MLQEIQHLKLYYCYSTALIRFWKLGAYQYSRYNWSMRNTCSVQSFWLTCLKSEHIRPSTRTRRVFRDWAEVNQIMANSSLERVYICWYANHIPLLLKSRSRQTFGKISSAYFLICRSSPHWLFEPHRIESFASKMGFHLFEARHQTWAPELPLARSPLDPTAPPSVTAQLPRPGWETGCRLCFMPVLPERYYYAWAYHYN
jgi:hypothetical protein